MRAGAALLVLLSAQTAAAQPAVGGATQLRLKAAFVAKFVQFVEWPSDALAARRSFDICVLGSNAALQTTLADLVRGETAAGRPLAVRAIGASDDPDGCQVLFAPAATAGIAAILRRAETRPILTVTDEPGPGDPRGIIQLRLIANRVRFDVDLAAARAVGVRPSAQLLRLAMKVHGGRP